MGYKILAQQSEIRGSSTSEWYGEIVLVGVSQIRQLIYKIYLVNLI